MKVHYDKLGRTIEEIEEDVKEYVKKFVSNVRPNDNSSIGNFAKRVSDVAVGKTKKLEAKYADREVEDPVTVTSKEKTFREGDGAIHRPLGDKNKGTIKPRVMTTGNSQRGDHGRSPFNSD